MPSRSDECGLRNQSHYWEEEEHMGIWGEDCEIAVTRCGADEVGIIGMFGRLVCIVVVREEVPRWFL